MLPLLLLAPTLLIGGDVSEIPEVEASGATYATRGRQVDPFVAMREAGWSLVRLRVWNDPPGGWCDATHTLALARRAKAQGLGILLDFHYSDSWADPGKQTKPAAWRALPFDALAKAVHAYTARVVGAMVAQGTPPRVVQVGNEIRPGMLWPDGRNDSPEGWRRLATLLKAGLAAVREASPETRTMLHLDQGGDNASCRSWFDRAAAEGVRFDLIGLSYYPWWHGPLTALEANLDDLAARYGKPVVVVELGYPWAVAHGPGPHLFDGRKAEPGYPATPQGQAAFVRAVVATVRRVPHGRGGGVLYWAPTWIGAPGRAGGYANLTTFDERGAALPAFDALGNPQG